MLPVPIVAARVAERAANPLISPSDEGSDLTDRLTAFPICLWMPPRRMVKYIWAEKSRTGMGIPHIN
jgi:hypothetical protein